MPLENVSSAGDCLERRAQKIAGCAIAKTPCVRLHPQRVADQVGRVAAATEEVTATLRPLRMAS
jgi:hypothetical protein